MNRYNRRVWLNDEKDQTAFVSAKIDYFAEDNYVDADIKIADCNRSINLSFNCGGVKANAASLKKMDRLLLVLTEFRAKLVKTQEKVRG